MTRAREHVCTVQALIMAFDSRDQRVDHVRFALREAEQAENREEDLIRTLRDLTTALDAADGDKLPQARADARAVLAAYDVRT